jgi:hypothetical protein
VSLAVIAEASPTETESGQRVPVTAPAPPSSCRGQLS